MIKRRHFLQATLATAGAAMAGCDGESETTTGTTTPTRQLEDGAQYFPQSVASGDPRPDSVILWTRVEDSGAQGDLTVELEISPSAEFTELISLGGKSSMMVTAAAQFDHCVKVRLAGISPGTVYYYRFIYESGGKYYVSKVGRTKTAPAADTDVPVKFAFVSCQDYIGRFYNVLVRLAREPLDFFVHLGDYVYETTGDPTFQNTTGRAVTFTDQAGALELSTAAGDKYYAAKSLSNYRELYKIYRADPAMQKMHESFPMIATWDDHEFSDDCHGAVASYFDGRQDETDVDRRKAANQAWFEYMPVDYRDAPDFAYDPAAEFPGDIQIWRDFGYGKHLHLVMTDLRTYRSDHLIPEDAYPGTVVVEEAALIELAGELPPVARPYVDIDDPMWAAHKTALQTAATAGGGDPAKVTGNISVLYLNNVVTQLGSPAPIDEATAATLPRGLAYVDAGKLSLFTSIGSRYFTVQPAFDLLAAAAYKAGKKSQDLMGAEQESWFLSTMKSSDRTWKIWGNEYMLSPLLIDLSSQMLPEQFKQKFYMNLDAWDGARDKRSEILTQLAALDNVVAITGDIHASYVGTPWVNGDPTKKLVEFVTTSVSSGVFRSILQSQVAADPVLSSLPGATLLAGAIDTLLKGGPNPHLAFADSSRNGCVVVDVTEKELVATYLRFPEKNLADDLYTASDADLDQYFKVDVFKTIADAPDVLLLLEDGKFLKWNPDTQMFE
jgi:alkaline phosphatase D